MSLSFVELVQKRVKEKTGMFATWLPTDKINIGNYGTISKGKFELIGQLSQHGVDFIENSWMANKSHLAFSDRAQYSILMGANAKLMSGAKCEITLSGKGAFVYQLRDLVHKQIENKPEFYRNLACLILARQVRWRDNYVFIDAVRTAGSATIIISESDSSGVILGGSIANESESEAPLAGITGKISIQISSGSVFRAVCEKAITPLYNPRRFTFKVSGYQEGGLEMLSSWFREMFGRDSVKPDEVSIHEYQSSDTADVITLLEKISGKHFVLHSRVLSIEEFNGSDPSGGGPRGRSSD